MTIATWGDLLVKKEYKMTMPILQNRDYTLSVAGTMGRNSVVAMLGNYMVIGRLKNNTITFRITDFTEEDTIVLICPEGGSITHAQLERGNKASDWTPAPEDAQEYTKDKVAEAKKYVDDLKNETIPALKDGLLNSSEKEAVKQSLNVVSADKKGIDMQYTTVYANTALTGTAKTNLKSAKDALNTAFTNLQSAINAVLGVKDGTRITTAQMTLVTTRLNNYGTALSTYNQRYEQAQDAISTKKKELTDAYALAQAELAEINANAYADGKITEEEKRAIADAEAKLKEAKKYVDDLEVGGRNYFSLTHLNSISPSSWVVNAYVYNFTLEPNTKYILSSNVPTGGDSSKNVLYFNGSGTSSNGAWLNNPRIMETDSNGKLFIAIPTGKTHTNDILNGTYWVQLEKGNKATDWKPAPEDVQEQIDNKANQDDLGSVEDSLNNLYTIVNDLDVQTIKDQLAEYQGVLSGVEADSQEAKAQLERILSEENGALVMINTILDKLNQRWTTLDGFIEINGSETALSISKGDTNMVIDSDSLTFYSGRTPVATITNQYMKIDRGIFVESMQVGRHLWAPSKDNRDHFVLSYSGDAPS